MFMISRFAIISVFIFVMMSCSALKRRNKSHEGAAESNKKNASQIYSAVKNGNFEEAVGLLDEGVKVYSNAVQLWFYLSSGGLYSGNLKSIGTEDEVEKVLRDTTQLLMRLYQCSTLKTNELDPCLNKLVKFGREYFNPPSLNTLKTCFCGNSLQNSNEYLGVVTLYAFYSDYTKNWTELSKFRNTDYCRFKQIEAAQIALNKKTEAEEVAQAKATDNAEKERREKEIYDKGEDQIAIACNLHTLIKMRNQVIANENEAGKISGVVNKEVLYRAGKDIVMFKKLQKEAIDTYRERFDRKMDMSQCK